MSFPQTFESSVPSLTSEVLATELFRLAYILAKRFTPSARDAHFFSHRVVNTTWNSLPDSVVLSPSLASFKRKLKFFRLFTYVNLSKLAKLSSKFILFYFIS